MRPMSHSRRFALAAAVLAAAACTETGPVIPDLPAHTQHYQFNSLLLNYVYVDSTPGASVRLEWSQDTTFVGFTCVQLVARVPGDTIGDFYFRISGANSGQLQREADGIIDTVDAFFLPPGGAQGSGGTYVAHTTGIVDLNWRDGLQSRYFDPTAVIRLSGDTLFSDVTLGFTNGVVEWHVGWIRCLASG